VGIMTNRKIRRGKLVRLPKNSVKVFTGLYLYLMDRLLVPP